MADYVSTTPGIGQFNAIGGTGSSTISITGQALTLNRGDGSAGFARTTAFSPVPPAVIFQFDISVSGNTTAQDGAATFSFGKGLNSTFTNQNRSTSFAMLDVNFTSTDGTFSLRAGGTHSTGTGTTTGTFSGPQTVRWVLNHSAGEFNYVGPDSSSYAIAVGKADLWVENERVASNVEVNNSLNSNIVPNLDLSEFRFAFRQGTGTITLDNISVEAVPEPATVGLMLGGLALAVVVMARRRRAAVGKPAA